MFSDAQFRNMIVYIVETGIEANKKADRNFSVFERNHGSLGEVDGDKGVGTMGLTHQLDV